MQIARTRNEDFNFVLTRYAMERLLYRISKSSHESTFILKGAILSVTANQIKEDADYQGVRVLLMGKLGTARFDLQVDIGFGDAVTPAPIAADFPVLLASPVPACASILARPSLPRSSKPWCSSGSPTAA